MSFDFGLASDAASYALTGGFTVVLGDELGCRYGNGLVEQGGKGLSIGLDVIASLLLLPAFMEYGMNLLFIPAASNAVGNSFPGIGIPICGGHM